MQVCTLLQTDNHASTPPICFLQARCPSCSPTNSVKALKARTCSFKRQKFYVQCTTHFYGHCTGQHVQLTTVRFFSAQCFTARNQRIRISDKTLEFSSTLDSVIYAVSIVHKKRLNKQSWFWRILEFLEMRFMCSAYHWTNNKLATVS